MRKWYLPLALAAVVLSISLSLSCSLLPATSRAQPPGAAQGQKNFDEAWNIVFGNYVDPAKLDPQKLSQAAIKGMIEALDDPYTSYLDPALYQAEKDHMSSSYQGIGAHVGTKDGLIIVISTIADSPAEKAGVQAGDAIVAVDGRSVEGLSIQEAVQFIRGPAGSTVKVTFRREGTPADFEIAMVRAALTVKTVIWNMKGDIAYLRITQFAEPTPKEFDSAVSQMLQQDPPPKGLILDLRTNPGGLLNSVVDIASHFYSGVVLQVIDRNGSKTEVKTVPDKEQIALPMVVLLDEFSASGSEVLSGALRDMAGVTLAGRQTFGKGSVNRFWPLPDGGAIYVTISRWATPKGTLIEGQGVEPDLKSDLRGEQLIDWATEYLHQQRQARASRETVLVG